LSASDKFLFRLGEPQNSPNGVNNYTFPLAVLERLDFIADKLEKLIPGSDEEPHS
jgi:hypothetical protein